ncbi:MAG TPA: retroviral-like aspartic protease family protein [Pirellulales bacterium]|jgi:hypothetical protein|nr:retroviral-like aspartic protease family protein [Pirellulales bacterium]
MARTAGGTNNRHKSQSFERRAAAAPRPIGIPLIGAALMLCVLARCGVAWGAPSEKELEGARQMLTATFHLTSANTVWCLPAELELRTAIGTLDRLDKHCFQAQQQVDDWLQQNRTIGVELTHAQAAVKQLQETEQALPAGSGPRQKLDDDLKLLNGKILALKGRWIPADRLGQEAPLKPALVDWIQTREDLTLAILTIRQLAPRLDADYEPLRKNAAVGAALQTLGARNVLGPRRKYDADLRRAVHFENRLLGGPVPIYREGNKIRVNAIVNEHVPATFTFQASAGANWIPASLAEAAGIQPSDTSPRSTIRPQPGRVLEVRTVTIAKLRLGNRVLTNVEAFLLPPEGEDLGAQLNREVVGSTKLVLDPATLGLRVE